MEQVGAVIAFKAKAGNGAEVARLVAAAFPSVEKEEGTRQWLVLRSETDTDDVFLVDVFAGAESRAVFKGAGLEALDDA